MNAPRWSLGVGLVQTAAGAFLLLWFGFSRILQGPLHWIGWFLDPASWPLSYLTVVGLVRVTTWVSTREAVGDPLVLAGLRFVQRRRTHRDELQRRQELGPYRRDRLIVEDDGELVVLSSRVKAEWSDTVTIEHGGRYYKCVAVDLQPDGQWNALAYRLREEPRGAIIRRLVRYVGPDRG